MSLEKYTLDSTYVINSPRSRIAMDRVGIHQDMLKKPVLSDFQISIKDPKIAEDAYNKKLQEAQNNLSKLKTEYESVKQSITYEEYLLIGSPENLKNTVKQQQQTDFTLEQGEFKIYTNEQEILKRAKADEAYRTQQIQLQKQRVEESKIIEEKHRKRLEEIEKERQQHLQEEKQRQEKIQQEKQVFTQQQLVKNQQLQDSMRKRDMLLREKKIEEEKQIQIKARQDALKQQQMKKDVEIKQKQIEKVKIQQFKEQQKKNEEIEKQIIIQKRQEQIEKQKSINEQAELARQRQDEIKRQFDQKQLEKSRNYEQKQKEHEERQVKIVEERDKQLLQKSQKFTEKTTVAKQQCTVREKEEQKQKEEQYAITKSKIDAVDEKRRKEAEELLKKKVNRQIEYDQKNLKAEQLQRQKEYQMQLKAVKTQLKLRQVEELQQKRDEIRNRNVQLAMKLDALKNLPEEQRRQRYAEILQNEGRCLDNKLGTSRDAAQSIKTSADGSPAAGRRSQSQCCTRAKQSSDTTQEMKMADIIDQNIKANIEQAQQETPATQQIEGRKSSQKETTTGGRKSSLKENRTSDERKSSTLKDQSLKKQITQSLVDSPVQVKDKGEKIEQK